MPMAAIQAISATLVFLKCVAIVPMQASSQDRLPISPKQAVYLAEVSGKAVEASLEGEKQLIEAFGKPQFRAGLLEHGAVRLASHSSEKLLEMVKTALASMEYTSNFGISDEYRQAHPGEPEMNFSVIDEFGHIPTMWELRAVNSSLVNGTPDKEWTVMESAETGLYKMPISSKPLPIGPNLTEARERPQYLAGNIHSRAAVGVPRYGVYAALVRNDVVRDRAVILPSDSGGYEDGCNMSIPAVSKWMHLGARIMARCNAVVKDDKRIPLGTAVNQMHIILANTQLFGKVGGFLSRLVFELLAHSANVHSIETLMYTEAGLLGPLRPQDMKLMVASFPSVFGTPDAIILRNFCERHRIPLAWALNGGESWDEQQIQASTLIQWMPFSPFTRSVGHARMLDPASWHWTNATAPTIATRIWEAIEREVIAIRTENAASNSGSSKKLASAQFKGWWTALEVAGGSVEPLRAAECESADLCFGTYKTRAGKRDCVCRLAPSSAMIVV
jgi:hypothetical protein